MGYLDNSTITVDAILTKKGRQLLSAGGNLNITHLHYQTQVLIIHFGMQIIQVVQHIMVKLLRIHHSRKLYQLFIVD